jgi:hypothetical protein
VEIFAIFLSRFAKKAEIFKQTISFSCASAAAAN